MHHWRQTLRSYRRVLALSLLATGTVCLAQTAGNAPRALLDEATIAREHFGADAPWYVQNIPFLEIDDPDIQRVYYYRWELYKAHMREIGAQGTTETEFLTDVPWARHPYTDLNDSAAFHILEGRWLRHPQHVESLVDHLYTGGGNDRHFSEWVAAATYAWTQVTGDPAPALRHLDAMQHIYNLWDDHFDAARGLYWIEPLTDATEYSIASIDASGAGFTDKPSKLDFQNGFTGGYAFRPSINAYQFANAQAIASLARLSGLTEVEAEYSRRAEASRQATLHQLWSPALDHFTDVYQRSTAAVEAGNFIRGRELVGYVPWMFELPPKQKASGGNPNYAAAWKHGLAEDELGGSFGLRTAEPSYPKYLQQYRFDKATGLPECEWNGPSWPFQTSQTLTGMANLLQDYDQQIVTKADYLGLLRQYARQHILPSGTLDLQEDYNPDTGAPIVGLVRSHHYNHSTYIDLVLSGLIGVRPHTDDVLELDPLLPEASSQQAAIRYFALQGLRYHGHNLTIVYDKDGRRYHIGSGLSVLENGLRIGQSSALQRLTVRLAPLRVTPLRSKVVDLAVNVWGRAPSVFEPDLPIASAFPATDGAHLYEAIDGRTWFFPEVANGWSPMASTSSPSSARDPEYDVDLRHSQTIQAAEVFFFSDNKSFFAPSAYRLQAMVNGTWTDIPGQHRSSVQPLANGENRTDFVPISAQRFRVLLTPASTGRLRLIEFKLLAEQHSGNKTTAVSASPQ